jgi:hypothetical protein
VIKKQSSKSKARTKEWPYLNGGNSNLKARRCQPEILRSFRF